MTIEEAENSGAVSEDGPYFMVTGSILDQKYVIGNERLRGGMAVVYRATGLVDKHERAVKVPLPIADVELSSLSFRREERALSDLTHKNIVQLVDGGSIHNAPYLVLEWLSGGDLTKRIEQSGPANWSGFYEALGRPLLRALC